MAQYDLILTQNVSAAGVEFSEKYVNLGKGDLLSGIATTKVPTVLAAGTNGYHLERDDNEVTGLKWVVNAGAHTQNTDTGTTSLSFALASTSIIGKMLLQTVTGAANKTITIQNQALTDDVIITLPNVTGTLATEAFATGVLAANNAMIFKGVATIATINALTTYNVGWTYRVSDAGTCWGQTVEIGDLMIVLVSRTGSSNVNGDWTSAQTNLDGSVIGPASVSADHIAQFSGTTGKLLKDGGVLGSMAAAATGDYVDKALYDAYTILHATSDNTPVALTVGEQTLIGRVTSGAIAALTPAQAMSILWVTAPADKIGTGITSVIGQIAHDANFVYFCTQSGASAASKWARAAIATNW